MKKHGIPLFLAAFLLLAPIASADDGSPLSSLEDLIGQLVALFVGDDSAQVDSASSPSGLDSPAAQSTAGDGSELGGLYPPGG